MNTLIGYTCGYDENQIDEILNDPETILIEVDWDEDTLNKLFAIIHSDWLNKGKFFFDSIEELSTYFPEVDDFEKIYWFIYEMYEIIFDEDSIKVKLNRLKQL